MNRCLGACSKKLHQNRVTSTCHRHVSTLVLLLYLNVFDTRSRMTRISKVSDENDTYTRYVTIRIERRAGVLKPPCPAIPSMVAAATTMYLFRSSKVVADAMIDTRRAPAERYGRNGQTEGDTARLMMPDTLEIHMRILVRYIIIHVDTCTCTCTCTCTNARITRIKAS